MHVPRPVVAFAVVAALFFTFVAAQGFGQNNDHGWAGPSPKAIRSYTMSVTLTQTATDFWSPWTTGVLAQVLPANFVVTDVVACSPDRDTGVLATNVLLFEGPAPKVALRSAATSGVTGHLHWSPGTGIPFAGGTALLANVRARVGSDTRTVVVTVTGYEF